FVRERILKPLKMVDTDFYVHEGKRERFASCYVRASDGSRQLLDDGQSSPFLKPPKAPSGGGGLVSTAGDYMRFCQMLLNKGTLDGVRLLGRKTVSFMTRNHLGGDLASLGTPRFAETNYNGIGFGLGFSVVLDPAKAEILASVGEYGWGGMASTAFWCDPEEEIAVVMLTQLIPSSAYPIRRELRTLVYQALVD
ncbi:MAG: serine hydrolase, partial [Hyphomicrobiaceae bacterium]|nr:serine hydrolase [Hyphomicrobiaceae bacterium]